MSFDIALTRTFGDVSIRTRFTCQSGLTALFAPSGTGKTSILNMVAGLLRPDTGHIIVGGQTLFDNSAGINLPPEQRGAGYVFQDRRLFPHMRVRANMQYGQRLSLHDRTVMTFDDAVDFLGIGHLLDRWPRDLSGGEAQRVAIGRALLSKPRFMLLDEPLSSLDTARREEIMGVIERIRDTLNIPILYVSHDRSEVDRLAANIIAL